MLWHVPILIYTVPYKRIGNCSGRYHLRYTLLSIPSNTFPSHLAGAIALGNSFGKYPEGGGEGVAGRKYYSGTLPNTKK